MEAFGGSGAGVAPPHREMPQHPFGKEGLQVMFALPGAAHRIPQRLFGMPPVSLQSLACRNVRF